MRIDPIRPAVVRFVAPLMALFLLLHCNTVNAQGSVNRFLTPSDTLRKDRVWLVAGSWTAIYGSALVGLNYAWYSKYERVPFHTFNDWPEWQQMDKAGHVWTAYIETRWTSQALRWSGVRTPVADAVAVGTAMLFQSTLEVLDAGSAKWGFSWSDMGANAAGAGLFYAQSRLWNEQRITVKYSYSPVNYRKLLGESFTDDARRRVNNLFGRTVIEQALKDYNGQTYWLSVNPASFVSGETLTWLNVAVGYGASGMFGGTENRWSVDDRIVDLTTTPRVREFYLSPDVDFTRIETNSAILKTVFEILNVVKMPAPALVFDSSHKLKFKPLAF